ncbi:hypothetical protein JCM3766R1_004098, partial [Sporobolomyces carnicolor]
AFGSSLDLAARAGPATIDETDDEAAKSGDETVTLDRRPIAVSDDKGGDDGSPRSTRSSTAQVSSSDETTAPNDDETDERDGDHQVEDEIRLVDGVAL